MNDANIEWNERYQTQQKNTDYQSSAKFFSIQENVDWMTRSLIEGSMNRVHDQLDALNFISGSTVLDIGAGPGTLAVPLAGKGFKVTVVEPSSPMTVSMEKYKTLKGIDAEISVIPQVWETVNPEEIGEYDYVISSFAMAVPDLRDALLKMDQVAKKQVHIFWFLNAPSWSVIQTDLWGKLHKGESAERSYADLIWNTLYQEGIYANLEVYPMKDTRRYADISEAVCEFTNRLSAKQKWQIDLVEEYLIDNLVWQDGKFVFPDNGMYAHIWWCKK
ncbi:MAG: class I SAM-dependent methyltransferase [Methanocorpusculum sp.]|uniref:class I SAM-dependent methyltransferase n=1 Tax=Methanocorpusculum sp. TaxID=2058474 RepID=UPI002725F424|nr:class I SAM-dependent methyltransferase [Methanocorpusculum sp.]MDO9523741.1 class I SAM-dependent methyltransferase [Methanocorpusculum sp.]